MSDKGYATKQPTGLSQIDSGYLKPHMARAQVAMGTHWPTGFSSVPTLKRRPIGKTPTIDGKMMSEQLKHY